MWRLFFSGTLSIFICSGKDYRKLRSIRTDWTTWGIHSFILNKWSGLELDIDRRLSCLKHPSVVSCPFVISSVTAARKLSGSLSYEASLNRVPSVNKTQNTVSSIDIVREGLLRMVTKLNLPPGFHMWGSRAT